jgi:SM-20-related protein
MVVGEGAMNPLSDWRPAAAALTERGFVVLPGAISAAGWRSLRSEAEQLLTGAAFSAARVGRGKGAREERATRGGSVCWLDASMPAGDAFLVWMDRLRVSLNRDLFLGLDEFEAHYAHYPVGTSYGTHVDRHACSDARVVSAVVYLNADWPSDAGGELVIYDEHDVARLTLAPEGGTLVLFMSEGTPHEARQATRERWSIAGWFRTRR